MERLLGLTFTGAAPGGLSAACLGQCGLHACEANAGPGRRGRVRLPALLCKDAAAREPDGHAPQVCLINETALQAPASVVELSRCVTGWCLPTKGPSAILQAADCCFSAQV